ncbi:hypothetical protein [Brachybacterium sp. 107]|uniref:hypothetical protein n=1 Tax=Brachybacterium sp. 107 TaxID=3457736 RepID=UPI0040348150
MSAAPAAASGSLTAVREVWAQRSQARTRGDVLYLVYVLALSVLIFGAPVIRAAGTALSRPDVVPFLIASGAPQTSTAITLVGGAGLVLLGAVRGPALLSPFFTASLASSAIPRRSVLWRPLLRSLAVTVLVAVIPAVLIAATLESAGHVEMGAVGWFALAAAGAGSLLCAAWFAGQLLGSAGRRLLAVALVLLGVGALMLPGGIGLGGAYPVGGQRPGLSAVVLCVAGILAVGAVMLLLDRLRGAVLQEQAARWESATISATTMDLSGAAGFFQPAPAAGRRLPAIGAGPLAVLYARRDLVAWLRSPERTVVGVIASLLSAAAVAGSTLFTGPLAWFVLLLGTLGLWLASGTFVDGIRHGVHTLGAPQLFGQSAAVQVLLHLTAPVVLLTALGALGGLGAWIAAGAVPGAVLLEVLLPAVLAPVLIIGRARDAAKGPMPLSLSTPMPTPQGDISVLPMLLWLSDAILLALVVGALLLATASSGALWMVVVATVASALMGLMARVRLRALVS